MSNDVKGPSLTQQIGYNIIYNHFHTDISQYKQYKEVFVNIKERYKIALKNHFY